MSGHHQNAACDAAASYPTPFRASELGDLLSEDLSFGDIEAILETDGRFLSLPLLPHGERLFVSKRAVMRWLMGLNLRMALAGVAQLPTERLGRIGSRFSVGPSLHSLPKCITDLGEEHGLLCGSLVNTSYLFPIASLLMSIRGDVLLRARDALLRLCDVALLEPAGLYRLSREAVEATMSPLHPLRADVLRRRVGFSGGKKETLEYIAARIGVSKERVRQIEHRARKELAPYSPTLVVSVVSAVMRRHGSVVVQGKSDEGQLLRLACALLEVPVSNLQGTELLVLGVHGTLDVSMPFPSSIDEQSIAKHLSEQLLAPLSATDIQLVARAVAANRLRHTTMAQRVWVALQRLGRPAHYTEVARTYATLFPDRPASEHNIHATLGREEHGVVWIGMKGTYALREWGFEHPNQGLYESVEHIVRTRYEETLSPVPLSVIVAEVGKLRRMAKRTSVAMAATMNPRLRQVSSSAFVPHDVDETEERAYEELDKALTEFAIMSHP